MIGWWYGAAGQPDFYVKTASCSSTPSLQPIDQSLYIKRVVGLPGDTLVVSPQEGFRVIRDINKLNDGYRLRDSVADDSHG